MQIEGDNFFIGVNESIDPANLKPGYLSSGVNIRIEDGEVFNRGGHQRTVLTNIVGDVGVTPSPLGTIWGALTYYDNNEVEKTVVLGTSNAWILQVGNLAKTLAYPSGVTINSTVCMVQADNNLVVFRGDGIQPLIYDGTGNAFELVLTDSDSPLEGGFLRMPWGKWGVWANERLVVLIGDELYPSNAGEINIYDPVKVIPVEQGTNDVSTGVFISSKSTLFVTKTRSLHQVNNFFGDLSDVNVSRIPADFGADAPHGVFSVEGNLLLPTRGGLYDTQQLYDTRIEARSTPMSKPIEKSYNAIDFSRIQNATGAVDGGYYYLAVPTTGSVWNNRVLVYSFINREWCGYDTLGENYEVVAFVKLSLAGRVRLFAISRNGYFYLYGGNAENSQDYEANYLLDENGDRLLDENDNPLIYFDETTLLAEQSSIITTRGYAVGSASRVDRGEIRIKTYNPQYSVGIKTAGVNEERDVITDKTLNNTKYTVIGRSDYDPTNTNFDHGTNYREDYSITVPDSGFFLDNDNGVALGLYQDQRHRFAVSKRDRYFQVKITNKKGAIRLIGIDTGIVAEQGARSTSKATI